MYYYSSLFVLYFLFFFFNDTATTEIYTLSLHDALPISPAMKWWPRCRTPSTMMPRSEEHTSELQSHVNLVCRLLLEKKKKKTNQKHTKKKKKNKQKQNKDNNKT